MNSQLKTFSSFILSLIIIQFFSCAKQTTTWQGTIEEIDGVTVVTNPGEPMYGEEEFLLEEELVLGQGEEDADPFLLISYLAVDDEENIYVSDTRACHIRVFDKNGNSLRTIGRKGEGPGELIFPTSIQILPRDEIAIQARAFLHFFSLQGEFLRRFNTSSIRGPTVNSKGNIIALESISMDPGKENTRILKLFDPELKPIMTLATSQLETRFPTVYYWEMRWSYNPIVWHITKEDNIIWGDRRHYEIFALSSEGTLIKKISTDRERIEMTNEDKDKLLDEWFDGNPPPSDHTFVFPKYFPAFANFACDDDGSVFVQTYERTEDREKALHDLFDSEGRYLARIPLMPRNFVLNKGKLYTIEEDEDDYFCVKRYRFFLKALKN
jgi:hypothetical protein